MILYNKVDFVINSPLRELSSVLSLLNFNAYFLRDAVTFLKATLETLIPNEREKAIVRIVDQIRKGSKPDRNLLQVGDIQKAVLVFIFV